MRPLTTLAALAILLAAPPAHGHQAPAGWAYETDCCNTQDCAPVGRSMIREVLGGYQVTIPPGAHPHLPTGMGVAGFIPHGDRRIRASGDSDHHACISRSGVILCLYVPPGGV